MVASFILYFTFYHHGELFVHVLFPLCAGDVTEYRSLPLNIVSDKSIIFLVILLVSLQ